MRLQNWFRIPVLILVLDLLHDRAIGQVTENRILQLTSGVWAAWGPWTSCSSSCGEGVTLRTRNCQRDNIAVACAGVQRQYKSCQPKLCPADSVPFRNIQCTLYNNKPIPGSSHQTYIWVPFYGGPIPCDLNCLAVGFNFYYSFGRVLDGTSCGPDSDGTCINGQCQTTGCDGILGSGMKNDSCGNCGGKNDSCVHIKDVYRLHYPSTEIFGYKNVTRIPAGAMHIKVVDQSRNILALMSLRTGYVINGNWAMSRSGVYKVAATEVHYSRATASHEILEASGPTDEDLYVLVLFQEQNPGIEYEYWLPKDSYYNIQRDSQTPQHPGDFALETLVRTPVSTHEGDIAEKEKKNDHFGNKTDCQKCMQFKGKSQRKKQYCQSDFVIRGKIWGKKTIGQETRYDVQIKHVYKNKFPLVHREYIWVSNKCDCPKLQDRKEYIMMPSKHVNYERTLNRILLTINSYVRPWSQREDYQMGRLNRLCRTTS
ncbi:ADAMTS-like protein 5 isoform X2 [Hyla sarda]|uniref:ADAMTS-like protein 5 isoform X2 n=1 Tax=Hyla sarda TaxID=327740 RepID=UPI0024C33348|nr:ADAMTS-like protein 5 isoform X2 [Hyla sarda]